MPYCVLFAKRLGDKIVGEFSKKYTQAPQTTPQPINEREMEGLKYMSGWVIFKLRRKE